MVCKYVTWILCSFVQIELGKRSKREKTGEQKPKQRKVQGDGHTQDPMIQIGSEIAHEPTEAHPFPSNHCCIGDYVALRLAKYDDEIPQIAQVVEIDELNVTVEWWIGRFNTWKRWSKAKEMPVRETFPRNAIMWSPSLSLCG